MKFLREHIISRILLLVLITALITPYAVKFTHIFEHHTHDVCLGEESTHLHELDLDCEFYKFKLTQKFTCNLSNVEFFLEKKEPKQITSLYHFFSNNKSSQFSLRGPPELV